MTLNKKTVTLKLNRIDICDLIIACTALNYATPEDVQKWANLHEKLKTILNEFDERFGY